MDLRVEKTRKSIINAFIALRAKKPIEKITVKELCEKALVNKSTFYSHYSDIYSLSDSLETEVVMSVIQALDRPGLIFENAEEFSRTLFLSYLSQDALIHTLFSGNRSSQLISKVEKGIKELVFREHPEYRENLSKNIGLTYAIYGSYYAFQENRNQDSDQVIAILGKCAGYAASLLLLEEQAAVSDCKSIESLL